MENDFTQQLIEKAKRAKSAEELLSIAEENEIAMSAERAEELFEQFNKSGELSDDELDNVSGGGCGGDPDPYPPAHFDRDCEFYRCCFCGRYKDGDKPTHACRNGGKHVTTRNHCGNCSFSEAGKDGTIRCHISDYRH